MSVVREARRSADAKAFFASERTFLHWLSLSVTFGGIAAGIIGISSQGHSKWVHDSGPFGIAVRLAGLIIMAFSIVLAIVSAWNFHVRMTNLRAMADGPYDSQELTLAVAITMSIVFLLVWIGAIVQLVQG